MPWSQIYDPFNAWPLSTAVAALPVLTLFFVLIVLKQRVWVSALAGMVVAMLLALVVFGMPAPLVGRAAVLGAVFGLLRIAWIIIASIFLYHVAVDSGQFQVMKDSIASLSSDRRIQAVLIAFCFGAFLEGTGGGGAPVAIAGAFLIGLGFPPFQAAVLCLLANTAPVAWGGVGNPIRVLAGVTDLPEASLSAMAGRILPPFSFILPIWLVRTMTGWKGVVRGDAGAARERRVVCGHAVLLVEPRREPAWSTSLRRSSRCWSRWRSSRSGDRSRIEQRASPGPIGEQRPRRAAAFGLVVHQGLVAVHPRVDLHLRVGPAASQPVLQDRGAVVPVRGPAQRRAEGGAGGGDAGARSGGDGSERVRDARDGGVPRRASCRR